MGFAEQQLWGLQIQSGSKQAAGCMLSTLSKGMAAVQSSCTACNRLLHMPCHLVNTLTLCLLRLGQLVLNFRTFCIDHPAQCSAV
jgi:hypothetical protein